MLFRRTFALLAGALLAATLLLPSPAKALDPENTLVIELKDGKVLIEMLPTVAPKHVEQIKTLVRQGFYDGIVWHRVMEGFMAQTGDPTGTGAGGSSLPDLPAEFSNELFVRGTVGMARSNDPNSGNSQFFICFADCQFLNGQYTVWGRVVEGMEFVDKIKKAPAWDQSGTVPDPDKMITVRILADVQ